MITPPMNITTDALKLVNANYAKAGMEKSNKLKEEKIMKLFETEAKLIAQVNALMAKDDELKSREPWDKETEEHKLWRRELLDNSLALAEAKAKLFRRRSINSTIEEYWTAFTSGIGQGVLSVGLGIGIGHLILRIKNRK